MCTCVCMNGKRTYKNKNRNERTKLNFICFNRINCVNSNCRMNFLSSVCLCDSLHSARVFRTNNKSKTKLFIDFIYMRSAHISFKYVYSLLAAAVGSSIFLFRSRAFSIFAFCYSCRCRRSV